jgi:hypothetical protein
MFSLFRSKAHPKEKTAESPAERSNRMDLEERKAFRQEMLYQSIRETFLSMEVIGSMYKFKVMPVDERHHRFIAMIDVAKSFVTGKDARTKSFASIEKLMRTNTYKRFGVLIEGSASPKPSLSARHVPPTRPAPVDRRWQSRPARRPEISLRHSLNPNRHWHATPTSPCPKMRPRPSWMPSRTA